MTSAHIDTFARDNLPPVSLQPEFRFALPSLQFPTHLNCATEILDRHIVEGNGHRPCVTCNGVTWTYADLQHQANRVANVLTHEMGLVPGNRVLLRSPNNLMMVACWFAVMKAGGIAVATMPLLRAVELQKILEKAQITHALCDVSLAGELDLALAQCAHPVALKHFNTRSEGSLDVAMELARPTFTNVHTASDDTCIIAFTSGTTGQPKGTMHFHRDVMAICHCWPPHVLRPRPGRRVHRQSAAGVHVRAGRTGALPDDGRCAGGAAGETVTAGAAGCDHDAGCDDALHGAHHVPRAGGARCDAARHSHCGSVCRRARCCRPPRERSGARPPASS